MSEPSSLLVKVKISKQQLTGFLNAKPQQPTLDKSWIDWWDSKEMYSKSALLQKDLRCYNDISNGAIIDGWINKTEKYTYGMNCGTFSHYDEAGETLHFGIIFFSENYFEMLPMIALVRSIATFKQEDETDFAIIYPYWFGGSEKEEANACLKFKNGQSFFIPQPDAADRKYVSSYLGKMGKLFSAEEEGKEY